MINLLQKKYSMRSLVISYICLVTAIELFAPDCLVQVDNQGCNSEGIDDTIAGWMTDLFLAICMFDFAYKHYSCLRDRYHHTKMKTATKSIAVEAITAASLSQLYMGMVFFIGFFAHIFFPNNGFGDGVGSLGYFIMWPIGFIMLVLSQFEKLRFISIQYKYHHDSSASNGAQKKSNTTSIVSIAHNAAKIFTITSAIFLLAIISFHLYCIVSPNIIVSYTIGNNDEYENIIFENGQHEGHHYDRSRQTMIIITKLLLLLLVTIIVVSICFLWYISILVLKFV